VNLRTVVVLALAAGCAEELPFVPPCAPTQRTLAPDETSSFGFSADEANAWYGGFTTVDVDWWGRHSDTPPHDTILAAIGAITGAVVETIVEPNDPADAETCATGDQVAFTRAATFATVDGEVTGEGTLDFQIAALDLDDVEIEGRGPVALSPSRQAEVAAALGDIDPPAGVTL
jgi:hypothetical protein